MSKEQTDFEAMREALKWVVEAHQNAEPLRLAMDHAASVLNGDTMLGVTSQNVIERCAAVCFARAEVQSTLQKQAYDDGRYTAGEGHWRAQCELLEAASAIRALPSPSPAGGAQGVTEGRKFQLGDRVTKVKGSSWTGKVVGFYSTDLTPIGYAVESEREPGSVQIYPEAALSAQES